ncbi:acyl transferase/acyl hydrolase/lysophospholipase [Chytridium lagenaria]|nr:acyl transferase/acyl hydrolase/lysophospholipase [Chytridium lagenaria]
MGQAGAQGALGTAASVVGVIFLLILPIIRSVTFGLNNGKPNQSIMWQEKEWVEKRETKAREAWKRYLDNAGLEGFDVDAFVKKEKLPRVALAFSGGGSRALLVGAGVIKALDERTGGILQLSTYISGLSGGSFLIGSLFTTNFETTTTSTTTLKMSNLANETAFKNYETPYPVVVWNERVPGEKDVGFYANIWESTFFETGSWSPMISAFVKTEYLGTTIDKGIPTGKCTKGFDSFALQDFDRAYKNRVLSPVIQYLSNKQVDSALVPNPFHKLPDVPKNTSNVRYVSLVDGGLDGQNVPIHPFLQPAREVDVIFATDSTVSYYEGGWPNGSSIISTAEYAAFTDFLDQGLVNRTVFFGCEKAGPEAPFGQWPLMVYIPNREHSFPSNASTFRRVYSRDVSTPFMMNGFDLIASGDAQMPVPKTQKAWSACVACALVSRALEEDEMTDQCRRCLRDYCWHGKEKKKGTMLVATADSMHPDVKKARTTGRVAGLNGGDVASGDAFDYFDNEGRAVVEGGWKEYIPELTPTAWGIVGIALSAAVAAVLVVSFKWSKDKQAAATENTPLLRG